MAFRFFAGVLSSSIRASCLTAIVVASVLTSRASVTCSVLMTRSGSSKSAKAARSAVNRIYQDPAAKKDEIGSIRTLPLCALSEGHLENADGLT